MSQRTQKWAAPTTASPPSRSIPSLERALLRRILGALNHPALTIVLWTGEEFSERDAPATRIIVHDRRTLWQLFWDPIIGFGDAYTDGRVEVEGSLLDLLIEVDRSMAGGDTRLCRAARRWSRSWLRRRTPAASRRNIHHHYDLGNEFYKLWLDDQLLYTCAYFDEPSLTLEQAQVAKMDYVCRKLWLQPGDRVVEAGCGWGALALHMAREYGVKVRALNISREQIDYARRRAHEEGLAHQVEFVEEDWRQIRGRYDAFVSVGMLEHVGPENYRQLGQVIQRCLGKQGRGLVHTIGVDQRRPFDRWAERRIFPGAQPPALSQMWEIFEPHGFSVLDVENIRLHYAETLKHWLQRFEDSTHEVRDMFDERFVRMWRLYLAASVAAFETGWLQLFQVVFATAANNRIPWTRHHLYQPAAPWTRAVRIRSHDAF